MKKGITYILIANILNLLYGLFTGFFLPKFSSIETYSNIKLFQLYVSYIGLISLGYADGVYLRLGGKNIPSCDKKEITTEFSTYRIFQFIVFIIFFLISIFLKNEILFLISIVILPINIIGYLRNLYQATGNFNLYSKFLNLNTVLLFLSNIFVIFIIKSDNYLFYISGYIITYFLNLFYVEYETRKIIGKIKIKFDFKYLKSNIKNGFFLMIGNFCNVIFTGIDRIFVQKLLGIIQFAYYSFAVSIESLLDTFISPFTIVMYNYFCKDLSVKSVERIKNIIILFSGLLISSVFIIKILVELFLNKYTDSLSVLYILFAVQYFSFIIKCIHLNLFKAKKKQNLYFKIMVLVIVLSIILNIIFYNINKSILFIAYATLIVNFIWFIIGEVYFKDYRLKIKNYIYIMLIIISFLLLNIFINNNYLAFIVYILIYLLVSLLFNRETFVYLYKELLKMLNRKSSA